jgi:hypothetical protein
VKRTPGPDQGNIGIPASQSDLGKQYESEKYPLTDIYKVSDFFGNTE